MGDELGAGGYGFVMTARHRLTRREVAVKFIIKDKVPEHGWIEDELLGRLPSEVVLLRSINHEGVVEFIDLFEDDVYFYLVRFFYFPDLSLSKWILDVGARAARCPLATMPWTSGI